MKESKQAKDHETNQMDGDTLVRVVRGQECDATFQMSPKGFSRVCSRTDGLG